MRKIHVLVKDGVRFYAYKGKYDEASHTVKISRPTGFLSRETKAFLVDPNHVKFYVRKNRADLFVVVDEASCKSVPVGTDDPEFDKDLENTLKYLIDKAHWEGRRSRAKISGFTLFITLMGGYGLIRFLEWILTAILKGGG